MNADQIVETLRGFFIDELGLEENIDSSTILFSSKLLDSMDVLKLMLFIEKAFGIKLSPMDVTLESFDTIERITTLIFNNKK